MKEGTVSIRLEYYNELRDFKKTIENDGSVRKIYYYGGENIRYDFFSKDGTNEMILHANKSLSENIEQLKNDKWKLNEENDNLKEIIEKKYLDMSLCKFIKEKIKYKN